MQRRDFLKTFGVAAGASVDDADDVGSTRAIAIAHPPLLLSTDPQAPRPAATAGRPG